MNKYDLRLSDINSPILLIGETGTGKSVLAKQIHRDSKGRDLPFVVVNLATMCESLFESEIFGCSKGAFTGAQVDRAGLLEAVAGGTLFLDEVGELSLSLQKKLLGVLEERRYRRLGSTEERIFSGRVIAATNRNLQEMVRSGEFREDLYFRLRVFCHKISPLRESEQQIRQYLQIFLRDKGLSCDEQMQDRFLTYNWPGNIRELKHAVEYLSVVGVIPNWMENQRQGVREKVNNYSEARILFEKKYFMDAIEENLGAINQTARNIQISKSTLIAKLRKYDIQYKGMKTG